MSRLKHYTHSLLSSYALLIVNIVYGLVSIPLALTKVSTAEFGLWTPALQIAGFISLIDMGMGSSVARFLIDHKDDKTKLGYGAAIKAGFMVGAAQCLISLVLGLAIVWKFPDWLNVPPNLAHDFLWLMIGHIILAAATFITRTFSQILYSWQRLDAMNYIQISQLIIQFASFWVALEKGCGIYSLLISMAASWSWGVILTAFACAQLSLWPKPNEWGKVSWHDLRELFMYGVDLFVITIGVQLILSSQAILITRELGAVSAAIWVVMTKPFSVVTQLVWRVISNAIPAFSEMFVRNEEGRLWDRYRTLFVTTSALAGAAGVLFAACNGPFVSLWTKGKFEWSTLNNVLLGIWMIALTQQCCHTSFISCLKKVGRIKYVYLLEGLLFVVIALLLAKSTGLTGILIISVVCTILCTWLVASWSVASMIHAKMKTLIWDWQLPLVKVLLFLVPPWLILQWGMRYFERPWVRLLVYSTILGISSIWALVRFALPLNLAKEVAAKLPRFIQLPLVYLASRVCPQSAALQNAE
jgi:O-antigen/teichoic acid export membrane protein